MRKIFILLIAILFLFCSCNDVEEVESESEETESEETETVEEITYEHIDRHIAISYEINYYGFEKDSTLLKIEHPDEWSVSKGDEDFDIIRDGEVVGCIIVGTADETDAWKVVKNESSSSGNVCVTKYIEQRNDDTVFRYRYVYEYTIGGLARTVTLIAACEEIDQRCEEILFTNVDAVGKAEIDTVGVLSHYLTDPSSILILGNSFISSSGVGYILNEMMMLGRKKCNVEAISRGYATVGTYVKNSFIIQDIRDRKYDAVFICGLYSIDEIEHLGTLKRVCEESQTQLVIFPAHNERANIVDYAKLEYPSLTCLNWKAELEALIAQGVDIWDLCYDDEYKHSTQVAGYVGAHMIYRAIYNELPTVPMEVGLKQSYIDGILGDYAYVGDAYVLQHIKYFD